MVQLKILDYILIILFFSLTLFIGIWVSRKSGKNSGDFFLSGKSMPWWLLGLSMVATTFSTDTPNFVTNVVRVDGVSGNWVWWVMLLTGLLTVFVYAKLWRRSNVNTDLEFYSIRYGGKPGKFLRKFRAVYLGIFYNVITMAAVTLAAIKIGGIILGISPLQIVLSIGTITVIFSTLGGFKGVVYTDFILFFVAMIGSIGTAMYLVNIPEVGGLEALITHKNVISKLSLLPDFNDTNTFIVLLIIPFAVQWWSAWYPGAEPGGGGYIAQRMLAAKNENHAIAATFFFNIMHFALRPWPWIIVALASLVVFPDIASIQEAFPHISSNKIGHDLAYPAMLTKLPSGLLGLMLASLISAYMSTISTQLNWGASYIVFDLYKNQINPKASEKKLVAIGRIATIILMVLSTLIALIMQDAIQIFNLLLAFGAGTGLVFILRWFWWRINAWSEITAMFSSGIISIICAIPEIDYFLFDKVSGIFPHWAKFIFIVIVTSIVWITTTLVTKPEKKEILFKFYRQIQPGGLGWQKLVREAEKENVTLKNDPIKQNIPMGILAVIVGCLFIYSIMFATAYYLYGRYFLANSFTLTAVITGFFLIKLTKKIQA